MNQEMFLKEEVNAITSICKNIKEFLNSHIVFNRILIGFIDFTFELKY